MFSSSSNRIRHERLFHHKDVEEKEEPEDEPEETEEEDEESTDDESTGDEIDHWPTIVKHAASRVELKNPRDALREPFLSEFVDEMKNFVEIKQKFIKEMEQDPVYRKIQEDMDELERIMNVDSREEVADVAWHNRRFKLRKVIEENLDEIEESEPEKD